MLIDGKLLANNLENKLKAKVKKLKNKPSLGVVLVGDDPASVFYIKKKQQLAERLGVGFKLLSLPAGVKQTNLEARLKKFVKSGLTGCIIQLPLPTKINSQKILNLVPEKIDVDGLSLAFGLDLEKNKQKFLPPILGAIKEVLANNKVSLKNKQIVILGHGVLVGRPAAIWLNNLKTNPKVVDLKTKNKEFIIKKADLIISGMGRAHWLKPAMVKSGVIIIDVGTTYKGKKVFGDVDPSVAKKAKLFTPTPGGIGPLTVVKLLENTIN